MTAFILAGALVSAADAALIQQGRPAAVETLAVMQSGVVTTRDLKERLELMPWPGKERASVADSVAEKALSALVAEKLLAAAFDRSGLRETPAVTRLRRGLENVFLRDELYREEAVGQARVPDELVRIGLARYAEEREVMVFQVASELDASFLPGRLGERSKNDSALRAYTDDQVLRSSPVVVRYGTMEQDVEDAAFRLSDGEVSRPVWSPADGWLVMVLLERRENAAAASVTPEEQRRAVEKVERSRSEARIAKEFYYRLLSRQKAQADPDRFESFASAVERRWRRDSTAYRQDGRFMFTSDLVDVLAGDLAHLLDSSLVVTEDGPIALGDILESLRYESFGVPSLEPLPLRLELNERIKAMVANELLAREARRRGYDRRESFRHDMRVWDDYWKSRRLYDTIVDTVGVSAEEMADYLLSRNDIFGDRFEVDVLELLVPHDAEMGTVLQELGGGRAFEELARERTVREEWKAAGGRSGFFRVHLHPGIGYRALLGDIGTMIGPVHLPEGRSLFVPLAQRGADGRTFDADSFRTHLHRRLLQEKRRSVPAAYVQELARQERLSIDAGAVGRMQITNVNMFTRRYIGFGGMMTAVPMLSSQWDWLVRMSNVLEYLP